MISMMNEKIGWRGKIGLIVNSGQIVTEPVYNRVAPPGISFFASRILVETGPMEDHASMEKNAFRAGKELAGAGVDCIAYCCTFSGILQGVEGNKRFCLEMEKETGIRTTSALSAILEGLEALRLKKLVLVSPYQEKQHVAEEEFFRGSGFHIVKSVSMNIDHRTKVPLVTPGEIYRFCRKHWDEAADGLLISCMNFNALPAIAPLEKDLAKPVLSSHSATLWKALRIIGVRQPVPGGGRLFTEDPEANAKGGRESIDQ